MVYRGSDGVFYSGAEVSRTPEYAGFGRRAAAKIIDSVIVYSLTLVFVLAVDDYANASGTPSEIRLGLILSIYLFMIGYNAGFVEKFGATPGKLLLGLRVVTGDGRPLTSGRAFARAFAELPSITLPLFIGYLIAAADDEKRTLHDRICGTRVVIKG